MDNIIEVKHLIKKYGDVSVVDKISFEVERGSLFAFLGTNGAGKSTTINILTTLIKQNSGEVSINGNILGQDDQKIREQIGVVFQNGVLDDLLTVKENLYTRAAFYKLSGDDLRERINNAVKITECEEFVEMRYGKLSGGQKRRADIARALINNPKILFLDEPTTGLDPKTRKSIWNAVQNLRQKYGMTIFLTTHYMEEAATADKVTIIKKGKVLLEGKPAELKEKYTSDTLKIYKPHKLICKWLDEKFIEYDYSPTVLNVKVQSSQQAFIILEKLRNENALDAFEMVRGSMDDVFLNVLGEQEGE